MFLWQSKNAFNVSLTEDNMCINLEESYYNMTNFIIVDDSDYGEGEQYQFKHEGKTWGFTYYKNDGDQVVSIMEVNEV